MSETIQALWANYNDVDEKLKVMTPTNEGFELLLEERDKLRNELIKMDQLKMESELKRGQIENENKKDYIRNIITVGTFVITTSVGIWTVVKTFNFDQTSTVTSTLGRTSLTNAVSKLFKR